MFPPYQQEFLDTLDFEPPADYLSYLFAADSTYDFGAAYLVEADELVAYNTEYEAPEAYPGYSLIGAQDSEAFAIEKATGHFIQTPFSGHDEETPIILGLTWAEFLAHLHTGYL
jgi:hypothetical protein